MNKVSAHQDQQAIINSANMVFELYGQMLRELYSDPVSKAA